MTSYIVLASRDDDETDERTRFVRDGFAPLALLFPVLWFLWHRLWLWAAAYIVLMVATNYAMTSDTLFWPGFALSAATSIYAGLEANNARVRRLVSAGYRVVDVIATDRLDDAEAIYFSGRAATNETPPAAQAGPASPSAMNESQPKHRQTASRPLAATPTVQAMPLGLLEWNGRR